MNVEQAKLMLELADALESGRALETSGMSFDMRRFFGRDYKCGTTCCAMGLACFLPSFRAVGLTVTERGQVVFRKDGCEYSGFSAASAVFGIPREDACMLFIEYGGLATIDYPSVRETPEQVAVRLRGYVRNHCPEALQ